MKYDVDVDSDYAAIINPIIERKRMMNSWDWSKDINTSGKAWNQVYDGGKGDHKIIPKRLIKEENNIALELEKRLAYIHDFFASLSDEEFVQMMIECGIKSSTFRCLCLNTFYRRKFLILIIFMERRKP